MKQVHLNAFKEAEKRLQAIAATVPGFQAEFKDGVLSSTLKVKKARSAWSELRKQVDAKVNAMKPGDIVDFAPPSGMDAGELQKMVSLAGQHVFGAGRLTTTTKDHKGMVTALLI